MANERIESGRVGLQMSGGNVPMVQVQQQPVDYVGFRAQAQTASSLAQVLDRMGSTTFKLAEERQTEAGLKYVAENPPTAQQIQQAKEGNLEPLNISGGFNVFDKAVRKARSIELAGHFEMEYRNKAADLLEEAKKGTMPSEQIAQKLNAVADGFVKSLSAVDGDAALKFRASSANDGYRVVAAARENEMVANRQKNMIKLEQDFKNGSKLLFQEMKNNAFIDSTTGQRISLAERINLEKDTFLKRAAAFGGTQASNEFEKKFEQELSAMKSEIISEAADNGEFGGTQQGLIAAINGSHTTKTVNPDGSVTVIPGKYTELLESMSMVEKKALRIEARRVQNEKDAARKDDNELQTEQDQKDFAANESNYMLTGNQKALNAMRAIAIRNPKAGSISHVEKLPQSRQSNQPDNFWGMIKVKDDIKSGLIKTTADLQNSMSKNGVAAKHANDLYSFIDTDKKRDEQDVERIARGVAKLVPGSTNISARQQADYYQFNDDVRKNHEQAFEKWKADGSKGLPPQKKDIAEQLVAVRRDSKVSNEIDNTVKLLNERYSKVLGRDFSDSSSVDQDLRDAMKLKKLTDPQIKEIETYLEGIAKKRAARDSINLGAK